MSKAQTPNSSEYWQHEDILELAERSAGIGVWNIDLATGMARGRPQFFRIMGLQPASGPVPMETIRALRHPDDRDRVLAGFQEVLASGRESYEMEYRIIRPDGQIRWIFGRGRILRNAQGEPIQYSGVDIDITERKAVEAALAESEDRYRLLVDHANDIVAMLDLDFNFTAVNPAVARILGYAPDEIVGAPLGRFIPPDQVPMHAEMLARKLKGVERTQYEMQLLGKNGQRFTLEVSSKLIVDPHGRPQAIHAVARDISERKDAEARQAVLLRELQHRTKNMLAVIQSIASNTLKRSETLEDAHRALLGRLHALAHAQEFVAAGSTAGAPLRELVEMELSPFGARTSIDGEPVVVGSAFAQMFALILHELATNAVKYGSLSSPNGTVLIRWRLEAADGEMQLLFTWLERGGPKLSTATKMPGFGSQLISLLGTPQLCFGSDGFEYRLTAPLSEVVGSGKHAGADRPE